MPKALVVTADEAWVTRSCRVLLDAGCSSLVVVIGAAADQVAPLIPESAQIVVNTDWEQGMGGSLRAGLRHCLLLPPQVQALVVMLVDLPGVTSDVIAHLVGQVYQSATETPLAQMLVQASFEGVIGHPVLLGRAHWRAIANGLGGDSGAKDYLAEHGAQLVELGQLADGSDKDTPHSGSTP